MHFYLFLDRMEKVMNTFDRFYKKTVIPILFIYVLSYIVCYNVIAYDTSIENGKMRTKTKKIELICYGL